MVIPEYPEFTKLTYDHKEELIIALKKYSIEVSELSLGFLYGYNESFGFELTKINGNICVYGIIDGIHSFLPPIGDNKITETIELCLEILNKKYNSGRINAVPKSIVELLTENKKFKITDDRDDYDYIYKVDDLALLKGSKYQSKRNFVLQFKKRYKYEYRKLTKDDIQNCIELQQEWCKENNCLDEEGILLENRCVYELLNNFEQLNLFGAGIYIENKLKAFTVAEVFNKTTVLIHIEKALKGFRGIYQAINNFFCEKELLNKFEFVNREQDAGDKGLRKSKLSYHPHHFIEKYNIELTM